VKQSYPQLIHKVDKLVILFFGIRINYPQRAYFVDNLLIKKAGKRYSFAGLSPDVLPFSCTN